MKNQVLLSSKDKSKKLKCLLQFLFGALRVKAVLVQLIQMGSLIGDSAVTNLHVYLPQEDICLNTADILYVVWNKKKGGGGECFISVCILSCDFIRI